MNRTIALVGVPSSAGAHWPGQEKAPQYLRHAGLVARLEAVGLDVIDCGDLPLVRFRPDREHRHQQNLATVVEVSRRVADQIDLALQRNAIPLVIGGDCTIGLGVIAGFLRHEKDLGLLYFDGHVDLNTPATSTSGILDSMACLAVFTSSPNFGGLTVTEFNPDHADEGNALAATFLEGLAQALVGKEPAMT